MNRRSFMRVAVSMTAAFPFGVSWSRSHSGEGGSAMPVVLLRQPALLQSRLFAEVWPGGAEVKDLGADLGDALLGMAAHDWRAVHLPIVGVTTPSALFCIEQTAAGQGLRTVMRQIDCLQGSTAVLEAARSLKQVLTHEESWRALPPMTDTHREGDLVYWLMAPSAYLGRKA